MNNSDSKMAADAICHAANMVQIDMQYTIAQYALPSVLYRPTLSIDGNQWCALYGENLQDGVAGFGSTPAEAMHNFNQVWNSK